MHIVIFGKDNRLGITVLSLTVFPLGFSHCFSEDVRFKQSSADQYYVAASIFKETTRKSIVKDPFFSAIQIVLLFV